MSSIPLPIWCVESGDNVVMAGPTTGGVHLQVSGDSADLAVHVVLDNDSAHDLARRLIEWTR